MLKSIITALAIFEMSIISMSMNIRPPLAEIQLHNPVKQT